MNDETSTGIFLLTCDIALSKLVEKLSNFLSASFIKFTFYNFLHYSHRLRRYIYIQQAYKSIDKFQENYCSANLSSFCLEMVGVYGGRYERNAFNIYISRHKLFLELLITRGNRKFPFALPCLDLLGVQTLKLSVNVGLNQVLTSLMLCSRHSTDDDPSNAFTRKLFP